MSDQYLWDRSGEPDPDIERLEALLEPFADAPTPRRGTGGPRRFPWVPLAYAASAAICAWGLWWSTRTLPMPAEAWSSGWIDTVRDVELKVGSIGRVNVAAGSRLRFEPSGENDYRMRLDHGKLDAFILAPPRQFAVATPSALAVDLGCAYTLEVDRTGDSRVAVRSGWVAFERQGQEAFIPAGAVCRASARFGLGIPYYSDAAHDLRIAVEQFEETSEIRLPARVRARDSLTLWHLLHRVKSSQRGPVFDQLATLIQVPADVSRESVAAGDRHALETLWGALGLGDSSFWRRWQRKLR